MSDRYDELVVDWPSAYQLGEQVVGGKGWNLARLHRYGLPVPPGSLVTAPVYDLFIEAAGLRTVVQECCDCPMNGSELPPQLEQLRERILAAPLPDGLLAAVQRRLDEDGCAGMPLAVSSSATGEDSCRYS